MTEMCCDVCYSPDIIQTNSGYVCKVCGIELEQIRIMFPPVLENYERMDHTNMGTIHETSHNIHWRRQYKLNNHYGNNAYDKRVEIIGYREIKRIFGALDLPRGKISPIFEKFKEARNWFPKRKKIQGPLILAPLVIYFHLPVEGIMFNEAEFLNVLNVSPEYFKSFIKCFLREDKEYGQRDRLLIVRDKLLDICHQFKELDMPFFSQAYRFTEMLWEYIKDAGERYIAGLTASIIATCLYEGKVSAQDVCKYLGISIYTVQGYIKKKIVPRFNISGFTTLRKSVAILQKWLATIGLYIVKEPGMKTKRNIKVKKKFTKRLKKTSEGEKAEKKREKLVKKKNKQVIKERTKKIEKKLDKKNCKIYSLIADDNIFIIMILKTNKRFKNENSIRIDLFKLSAKDPP